MGERLAAQVAVALLGLVCFNFAGRAHAQDEAACATYQEPMAYNACLASHGPKANDIGRLPAGGGKRGAWTSRERGDVHATRKHGRSSLEFLVR